jgi:hypothetical protein
MIWLYIYLGGFAASFLFILYLALTDEQEEAGQVFGGGLAVSFLWPAMLPIMLGCFVLEARNDRRKRKEGVKNGGINDV